MKAVIMKDTIAALTILLTVLSVSTSCQTKNVTVGVENARFQHGYLNSKLLGPGALLLWDMEAADDRKVTLTPGPDTSHNRTVRHAGGTEQTSRATSGVEVSGTIPIQQVSVDVRAQIARQTTVTVKQFESQRFYDPDYVLNQAEFAPKRMELGKAYADNDQVRFIFIAGATVADDAQISTGTPTGRENEFKLTIAGKEYKLTYIGTRSLEWKGSQEPVFIQPRVYKIQKDPRGETGYRFVEDRQIPFDLSTMLTDSQL